MAVQQYTHHTSPLFGRPLYYTKVMLAPKTLGDLQWWTQFFRCDSRNTSQAGNTWEPWVSLRAMVVAPALEGLPRKFSIRTNLKLRPGWEPGLPGLAIFIPTGGNYVRYSEPYNGSSRSPPDLCAVVLCFTSPTTTWCCIMWSITAAPLVPRYTN
jgi:hypothetical protein